MAAVSYVGVGAFTSGTGAITVPMPTFIQTGDLLLLFVETAREPVATPSGWTAGFSASNTAATPGNNGAITLQVFYKISAGNELNVSVADAGDHQFAAAVAYRGVNPINPFYSSATGFGGGSTFNLPSVISQCVGTRVVYGIGLGSDFNTSNSSFVSVTSATLTSLTTRTDNTVNTAAGGGIAVLDGVSTVITAVDTSTSNTNAAGATFVAMALNPKDLPSSFMAMF